MNIGVLGCGNMASAVVLNMHEKFKEINFFTYTPSFTRAKVLADSTNSIALKDLSEFKDIDYWIIGCKPQQLNNLAKAIGKRLKNQKIVSMLAATKESKLESLFETKEIIRIMPNTPVKLGLGITLFYASKNVSSSFKEQVINHNQSGSKVYVMKTEEELDKLTVITGSGPAYIFYLAQTLEEKLQSMGVDKENSRDMINNLFLGSSELMYSDKTDIPKLVDQVTSKGGVTIEAIQVYKEHNLMETTSKAIDAALIKTDQIALELN
jgi:pyrroline-5-carboxylate reductase